MKLQIISQLLLFVVSALADLVDHHEAILCKNDNTPACGLNSHGEYLLFTNECHLQEAQKAHISDELHKVSLRYCLPGCDFNCDLPYKPICGISTASNERRTFHNLCELARLSCVTGIEWQIYMHGTCAVPGAKTLSKPTQYVDASKQRLPLPCPKIYKPVCASFAEVKSTFDNDCQVNAEIIKTGKDWRIISKGICAEDFNSIHYQQWLTAASSTEPSKNAIRDIRPKGG